MDRRGFIAGSAAAFTVASLRGVSEAPAPAAKKPNFVFMLCDEWRGQATGYAGDVNAHTPTLNKLAAESANFVNVISGLPLCCPARACLMTGQYPLTNGVFINDVPLAPNDLTMGEVFKNAGYRTGYIGKWHLHGSPDGHYGRRGAFIPPDKHFGWDYWKANECDHNYNHEKYYFDSDPTPRYWPGYAPTASSEDACSFIKAGDRTQPFALVLSMAPPHFPYQTAPAAYRALYAGKDISLRPNVPPKSQAPGTEAARGYYAHIAALDDCVKRVLATLDEQGIADDTVVVFSADHGDMLFSQGLQGKLYPWDESLRIPLLMRYPRAMGSKGMTVSDPANSPDIMPTILGLCGLPIPKKVQGTDFSALLKGRETKDLPSSTYINNPVSTFQLRQCGFDSWRGVRTRTHTYVRAIEGPWLLYDNVADPFQKHNLCGKPEAKDMQAELDAQVLFWRDRLHDEFLPGAEYLKRANLAYYFETKTPIGQYSSPWGDWGPTMNQAGQGV
jgi:arylsulfatase A-like enzyme